MIDDKRRLTEVVCMVVRSEESPERKTDRNPTRHESGASVYR